MNRNSLRFCVSYKKQTSVDIWDHEVLLKVKVWFWLKKITTLTVQVVLHEIEIYWLVHKKARILKKKWVWKSIDCLVIFKTTCYKLFLMRLKQSFHQLNQKVKIDCLFDCTCIVHKLFLDSTVGCTYIFRFCYSILHQKDWRKVFE